MAERARWEEIPVGFLDPTVITAAMISSKESKPFVFDYVVNTLFDYVNKQNKKSVIFPFHQR